MGKIITGVTIFFVFSLSTTVFASVEVFFDPNLGYKNNFGYSVDIDGNTAIVGAPSWETGGNGPEAAYVYTYDGLGWNLDATLSDPCSSEVKNFGWKVAIDSNTIVVGAYKLNTDTGIAYVYEYSGGQWTGPNVLTASDGNEGFEFGYSVDIQNDTIVIGAREANDQKGAAYVFEYNDVSISWEQVQKLTASDGKEAGVLDNGSRFGRSVSIDNDIIVVGAYYHDDDAAGIEKRGHVYVYNKSGGSWPSTENYKLLASDAEDNDQFGYVVSISGGTIAVTAIEAALEDGKVYIYDWNDTDVNWVEQDNPLRDLTSSVWDSDFGNSLTLDGNTLLVGASKDNINGVSTGTVHLCVRDGNSWSMKEYFSSESVSSDRFGWASSFDGTNMIVGAYRKDHFDPSVTNCGAAYFLDILAADINGDGWVDFEDFAILADQWLQVPSTPSADIAPTPAGDNVVNGFDLLTLAQQWLR